MSDIAGWIHFFTTFLNSTLVLSVPIAFAALGGVFSERSGVFNIGLEGLIIMGAFGAALGVMLTGEPFAGLLLAMLFGALLALPLAVMAVSLGVNQLVAGIAINIFALGLTSFLARLTFGREGASRMLSGFENIPIPGLSSLPLIGPVLFDQDILVYLLFVLVPILYYVMFHTSIGLNIRAAGYNPRATDTAGVSVHGLRYLCVIGSGVLASIGGAYIVLSLVSTFSEDMSAGKGFIALAAIILGRWSPLGAFLACLLFGFFNALQLRLQFDYPDVPYQIFSTLPYVVAIVVLIFVAGRNVAPTAIGRYYDREGH